MALQNWKTPELIRRKGIVLSRQDVPYESVMVYNAGVARWKDGYVMLFRNDYGISRQNYEDFYAGISEWVPAKTNIGAAFSSDGVTWKTFPEPVFSMSGNGIRRAYDPRITLLEDGRYAVCVAVDTRWGIRGGIVMTSDFRDFEVKSMSVPENRNMVIFPEKIGGQYVRLERPFRMNDKDHSIWLSRSPDLIHWGESELVLAVEDLPYADLKIGPAAPPVKTPHGWLTMIHGVEVQEKRFDAWGHDWRRGYYGGLMLLDLENPAKIKALSGVPLLVPEEKYEMEGFRGGVVFPGGLIDEPDGTVKIYYGAADTVECLAEAKMDDLIRFCFDNNIIRKN